MTRSEDRERPRPKPLEIAASIRDRIQRGEIPLGSKLKAAQLAAHYGVSRSPIREALQILAATHVVKIDYDRGARVSDYADIDTIERIEIWGTLFSLAAARAAEHGTKAEKNRLKRDIKALDAPVPAGMSAMQMQAMLVRIGWQIVRMGRGDAVPTIISKYAAGVPMQAWLVALQSSAARSLYASLYQSVGGAIVAGNAVEARIRALGLLDEGKKAVERVLAESVL